MLAVRSISFTREGEDFNYTIVYQDYLRKPESLCSYKKPCFIFKWHYSLSKNKVLPNSKFRFTITHSSVHDLHEEVLKNVECDGMILPYRTFPMIEWLPKGMNSFVTEHENKVLILVSMHSSVCPSHMLEVFTQYLNNCYFFQIKKSRAIK